MIDKKSPLQNKNKPVVGIPMNGGTPFVSMCVWNMNNYTLGELNRSNLTADHLNPVFFHQEH